MPRVARSPQKNQVYFANKHAGNSVGEGLRDIIFSASAAPAAAMFKASRPPGILARAVS
jgi:hypothetical protein